MKTNTTDFKLLFTLSMIALLSFTMHSQAVADKNGSSSGIDQIPQIDVLSRYKTNGDLNLNSVDGSPYANNYFSPGFIFFNDVLFKDNLKLRFNQYTNEIEILGNDGGDGKDYSALSQSSQFSAQISGKSYYFFPDVVNNEGKNGAYLEELSTGKKHDLYAHNKIKYKPEVKAATGYEEDRKAKFTHFKEFYFSSEDGVPTKLPNKTKKVTQLFEKDYPELKAFIKKSKLKVNDRDDLIKIFTYLNNN